jgi:hypothetical protein
MMSEELLIFQRKQQDLTEILTKVMNSPNSVKFVSTSNLMERRSLNTFSTAPNRKRIDLSPFDRLKIEQKALKTKYDTRFGKAIKLDTSLSESIQKYRVDKISLMRERNSSLL